MKKHEFTCIDGHTCGNPVRLIKEGGPELEGNNMSEKRQHFLREFDWIRKGLMFEPRGHDMMSGSILYPPTDPSNDVGILFLETSGCLPMCGHGTIGSITMAIEEGLIHPKTKGSINMEAPAGLVKIRYHQNENGKVEWVQLTNVVSYLAALDLEIESSTLGPILFDVAYGGNFYAIVDPQSNFKGLEHYSAAELIQFSQELRTKINKKYPGKFIHPEDESIRDVSHLLWTGNPLSRESSGRNAVFYGDKAIDRSPCGTGTSARMAQLHAKGLLTPNEEFIHESIIGSKFVGKIESEVDFHGMQAIIPSIKGWAVQYGYNKISIDSASDPYAFGFQVI